MIRKLNALLGRLALTGLAAAPALSPGSLQAATEEQGVSAERAHQRDTVALMRNIGTAMFSWLTDQVGAAADLAPRSLAQRAATWTRAGNSPQPPVVMNMSDYPLISSARLREILAPNYIPTLGENDGWGNPFEFRLNVDAPLGKHVMCIRSPGRDGRFSGDSYSVGSFDPDDFDQDIVWCDGFFVRWPQRTAKPGSS